MGAFVGLLLLGMVGGGIAISSASASDSADRAASHAAARRASLGTRVQLGAYVGGMQADPSALTRFEQKVGRRTDVASYYYGYGDVFPGALERTFADGGRRKVLVSWDMGATRFTDWSSGAEDSYLDTIAAAARAYPYPLYVRPWPEMNGDWQSFQPTPAGDRPRGGTYAEFKEAWRYVVTYLRDQGADNLRWVFNPTADTYAETTPVRAIWPGSAYVDVLGLDGFNWGNSASGLRWRSFRDIFVGQYRNLTALGPDLPVWICETASKEPRRADGAARDRRHDKAEWVTRMLRLRGMSRIGVVIWFDVRKERDWRVDSSRGALRALRAGLGVSRRR